MTHINCSKCNHKSYCQILREKTSQHFRWSFHNIIGHPLSEIVYLLGFKKLAHRIHNKTTPKPVREFGEKK
jgi:hypothetical protein